MNRNPKNLSKIEADDDHCNARCPAGYCKKPAGWGTEHNGTGRCKLHGGSSLGRPIEHGLYSKKMKSSLQRQLADLVKHPSFKHLYEEFGIMKLAMANLLDGLDEDFFKEIFVEKTVFCKKCGGSVFVNTEEFKKFAMVLDIIERMGRTYDRITKAEINLKKVITLPQLQYIYRQIAKIVLDVVKDKEQAREIYNKLMDTDLFFDPAKDEPIKRKELAIEEAEYEDIDDEEELDCKDIFGDGQLIVYYK